jgi:hypothetical protein
MNAQANKPQPSADTCTCGRCPPSRIARGLKCFNQLAGSTENNTRRVSCEMPGPRYSFLRTPFRGIGR